MEILLALYYSVLRIDIKHPLSKKRDRFILSGFHFLTIYRVILTNKGFFC